MNNALLALIFISPFVFAVFLANLAERNKNLSALQYAYLLLINGFLFVAGLGSLGLGLVPKSTVSSNFGPAYVNINWTVAGAELMAGAALAVVLLLPPVRRFAARLFDIDPLSVVHATALSLTATAFGLNLFQMNLNSVLLTPQGQQIIKQTGGETYMDILVFPLLTLLLTALLGIGWLTRRSWPDVVQRLGWTTPSLPQLGLGVLTAAVLLGLSYGTDLLWAKLDPAGHNQVGGVSQVLMGNFTGISGAFAVGITAAIGEESFFRGAYLPRMGVFMSALLFASFHVQYFLSLATLLVFVIGLILGVLRVRTTLAVSILVHFLYNFASVLMGS